MQSAHKLNFYLIVIAVAILACHANVEADEVNFTGNLTSDGASVGGGDPVVNPAAITAGDPFSIALTYNPASFTQSGSSFLLTDASLKLQFDGYSFNYSAAGGNAIEFSTPGVFGPGTVSFHICSAALPCDTSIDDFIDLYFAGTVTDLSTLAGQADGLSGDPSASPSQFEFLRNFDDGSQTDLQGILGTPTGCPVPEPSMPALLVMLVAVLVVLPSLKRLQDKRRKPRSAILTRFSRS